MVYTYTKQKEKVELKKLHGASRRKTEAKEVDMKQEGRAIRTANEVDDSVISMVLMTRRMIVIMKMLILLMVIVITI